jgi:hypothetical protein
MAREVATSIVEIHMEQQKIELMKLEMAEIQKECEKLIEDNKAVQQ